MRQPPRASGFRSGAALISSTDGPVSSESGDGGRRLPEWLAPFALLAIAAAVAAAGLGNGFAGDDVYIIARSSEVHSLSPPWEYLRLSYWPPEFGGTLYRPVAVLGFALQWKVGAGAPAVFHAVNLLLYVATVAMVWVLARQLLSAGAAWLVAAFFAVHPVHVEAVANVVGQGEILVAGLNVAAVAWYVAARRRGELPPGTIAGISALYLLSCFTKETGLVLPALLLLAELAFGPAAERPSSRLRQLAPLFGLLVLIAAGSLAARSAVLGGIVGEYPHPAIRGVSFGSRMLTMLGVVPQWWRLLLVPWHLQADYMPLELDRATGFGPAQALGLSFVVGWGWAAWQARHKYPVATFGLGWVAITLLPVSNILVPTGILLAERTLFLPSVGACLAVGGVAPWIADRVRAAPRWERIATGVVVGGVLLLWAGRSAARATVWRNDSVLVHQTVIDAPLSYRAHAVRGRVLFEEGNRALGEQEYQIAIRLYPHDPNVFAGLAKHYRDAGRWAPAIPLFRRALELAPQMPYARSLLIDCLARTGDGAGAAVELAEKVRRGDPDTALVRARVDSIGHSRPAEPQPAP